MNQLRPINRKDGYEIPATYGDIGPRLMKPAIDGPIRKIYQERPL
jgi:hypothetical protein